MIRKRRAVGALLVDAVVQDKLVLGGDLRIVRRLELSVPHVVVLHPHEGGIGIGFAVGASFA